MRIYDSYDGVNKAFVGALIVTLLWFIIVPIGIWGCAHLNKEAKLQGNGYLELAKQSSSIEMSLGYLYKYKEIVEIGGFTEGTCGLYFKTPDNAMSFRYQRLTEGIKFLEDLNNKFQEENRINTIDFATINQMIVNSGSNDEQGLNDYIDNLDVGIKQYLSANYIGWRFFDIMSLIALIYGIIGFFAMMALWICIWSDI